MRQDPSDSVVVRLRSRCRMRADHPRQREWRGRQESEALEMASCAGQARACAAALRKKTDKETGATIAPPEKKEFVLTMAEGDDRPLGLSFEIFTEAGKGKPLVSNVVPGGAAVEQNTSRILASRV